MTKITIAIPTFGRETVMVETIEFVLALLPAPDEVLLIDQTPKHEPATTEKLARFCESGKIRILQQKASIPRAMNRALKEATSELVLFLDDDIIPSAGLIAEHLDAHRVENVVAVVGQVLQPGEEPVQVMHCQSVTGLKADLQFCFRSTEPSVVQNVMAGNLSVKREAALAVGGFDENFIGVAYRFETEFARRLARAGTIRYQPGASIHHLAAARGGTRSYGTHLTTHRPEHSVGDYYFAMLEGNQLEAINYCSRRLLTSVLTRFHLKHPWYIPSKLVGEVRGLLWALQLRMQGQKLVGKFEA